MSFVLEGPMEASFHSHVRDFYCNHIPYDKEGSVDLIFWNTALHSRIVNAFIGSINEVVGYKILDFRTRVHSRDLQELVLAFRNLLLERPQCDFEFVYGGECFVDNGFYRETVSRAFLAKNAFSDEEVFSLIGFSVS